ncbi:MAG: DUF6789 family protein [Chloroflexota bacterium]|nr:MAG: hypothetical protein DLM70_11105 [Chloroflexota bacterium]
MGQETQGWTAEYGGVLLKGALAGCTATGPMTLFMLAAHRFLPLHQRSSLPPKKLTMHVAQRLGLKKHMDQQQRDALTWAAHFGYGTGMGALYSPLAHKVPVPGAVKGTVFGLAVWAAAYAGGLPAMTMPEAASEQPWQRNALMISAHAVWGLTVGLVVDVLDR